MSLKTHNKIIDGIKCSKCNFLINYYNIQHDKNCSRAKCKGCKCRIDTHYPFHKDECPIAKKFKKCKCMGYIFYPYHSHNCLYIKKLTKNKSKYSSIISSPNQYMYKLR